MKKLLLAIPITLLFIHFAFQSAGPNIWTQSLANAGPIWSIAANPTNPQIMYAASNTQGMWKTTNGGVNWALSNTGITNNVINFVAVASSSPTTVYCGGGGSTVGNGMYKSTDSGGNWVAINNGITQVQNTVQNISVNQTNANDVLIAVWDGGTANATVGLFRTTDGGANWTASNTGMGTNKNVLCLARNPLNPNTVYCGTSFLTPNPPGTGPAIVYKSYNAGATWVSMSTGLPSTAADINPIRFMDVSRTDTSVVILGMFYNIVAPNAGVYYTSNGGTSWVQRSTGLPNAQATLPRSVLIRPGSSTEFFCGIASTTGGIFRTTDAGVSWTNFTSAPLTTGAVIRHMYMRTAGGGDSTLFIANSGTAVAAQGVFEYTFVPLGIYDPNKVPTEFALMQNYPNPFNPVTKIVYQIPRASYVKLSVYDAKGQLVSVLVDGYQTQLTNTLDFNAEGLSTGVYFYKMEAGDFSDVKKMILIK